MDSTSSASPKTSTLLPSARGTLDPSSQSLIESLELLYNHLFNAPAEDFQSLQSAQPEPFLGTFSGYGFSGSRSGSERGVTLLELLTVQHSTAFNSQLTAPRYSLTLREGGDQSSRSLPRDDMERCQKVYKHGNARKVRAGLMTGGCGGLHGG